jgi:TonB family protein
MKGKDKKSGTALPDLLKYIENRMSGKERNSFERELQKDPFAEEAAEGFSEVSPEEASDDIAHLEKKLKNRLPRKNIMLYYRIAASVAVLMILSSVYIYVRQAKTETMVAEIPANTETFDISRPEAIIKPEAATPPDNKNIRKKQVRQETISQLADNITTGSVSEKQQETIAENNIKGVEIKNAGIVITKPEMAAQKPLAAKSELTGIRVRGRILSSDDDQPVPGATLVIKGTEKGVITDNDGNFSFAMPDTENVTLVASYIGMNSKEFAAEGKNDMEIKLQPSAVGLNEVVVVGYGVSRKENVSEEQTGYSPPQPVAGRPAFNKYIEENIHKPASLREGDKAVVIINFTVTKTGEIEEIKVLRSPGIEFSDEAIRLVKEGPQWKPAERDGARIDDEIRLRIVFK